jgi:hypothetical protein
MFGWYLVYYMQKSIGVSTYSGVYIYIYIYIYIHEYVCVCVYMRVCVCVILTLVMTFFYTALFHNVHCPHAQLSATSWRCMGEWRYSFTILGLDTRWNRSVILTIQMLCPWRVTSPPPHYLYDRRLGGPESLWMLWSQEKSLAPARNWTLVIQPAFHCNTNQAVTTVCYTGWCNTKLRAMQ